MPQITDSKYIKKYKKRMRNSIVRIRPDWDEDKIDAVIDELIIKNVQNPVVEMDNNYTGEHQEASLLSVMDWVLKKEPIIAGNSTFYKNQYEALNPSAVMLMAILKKRKDTKKKMFKLKDDTSDKYHDLDREQGNYKTLVNSYYGGSGAPTSSFYSKWSGPATTLSAQQIISTTENTFEAFVADNYKFIDLNEFFDWVSSFLDDAPLLIDSWVQPVSETKLYNRIISKLIKVNDGDHDIIRSFVSSVTATERMIIYYKNNLIKFINDHENIMKLYRDIFKNVINYNYCDPNDPNWRKQVKKEGFNDHEFETVTDWNNHVNKEYFMDPNSLPDSIKDKVKEFSDILLSYIYTPYMPFDRVYRLKNFKRKTVTVIDTDSNILALDNWVKWTMTTVMKSNYDRDKMKNIFIAVNTITYVLTEVVTKTLLIYGEYANIPAEFRSSLNMKNEFMFIKLIIGKTKKRYLSKVILREGNLMLKPKTDVKGFDFIKSTTSRESEKFFKEIIDTYIMGDTIDIKGLLNALFTYSKQIEDSMRRGELHYLQNTTAKELNQYKNPSSQQSVRGVLTWNLLNPDTEIDIPSKPKILKLNIFTEDNIEPIKYTFPDEYAIIKEGIFNDKTGIFVTYKTDKKNPGQKIKKDNGCTVLCIPSNKEIPEWCKQFIDYQTMINNILAPFKPVTEIFGIRDFSVGKTINGIARKSNKISNIVKF